MKLLFSTIIVSSFLSFALVDSFNIFDHIGDSPQNSDVSTSRGVGYSITFINQWTGARHPYQYPSDSHWSQFLYASHSSNYVMWENGGIATDGIENVAEIGSLGKLRDELGTQQNSGNVLGEVVGDWISNAVLNATSIPEEHLCVDASHPLVSGISMIAPSPDWFSGVYNLPLSDSNTMTWLRKIEVYVYAWDAGTEEGDGYSLSNPSTDPREAISAFTAGDTKDAVFVSEDDTGALQVLPVGILTFDLEETSAACATTASPTSSPTASPTAAPTAVPGAPTAAPTAAPTSAPTLAPTAAPTLAPTSKPTKQSKPKGSKARMMAEKKKTASLSHGV